MRETLLEHIYLARNLRKMRIYYDPSLCQGVWECYEVCPTGCWVPNYDKWVVSFQHAEHCVACGACVLQCPEKAIELR